MTLSAGTALTAGLVLEREIGKGGMGTVWVAKNAALGTRVAVKVLRADNGAVSDEARRRFEQEARGLAQLEHPNLVRIFDFGMTEDGDPYIVMELLRGEDLAQRLIRGPIDLALASNILRQTCRALARAHEAGVVHRDIKPANIFLAEADGEVLVKVLDFGVARFEQGGLDSMTKTGAMVGTPFFMSPEQHMNPKGIDHRSDLWSVAVVAFICLTGRMPFEGETITRLGYAVMEGQRPTLRSLRPDLPAALDIWMDRALAREPSQRYQSAKDLAEAFDRARSASPSHVSQAVPSAVMGPVSAAMPSTAPSPGASPPPGQGAAPAPNATPAVAPTVPVIAGPAPVEKKRSMAPMLVLGAVVIAGLAGGGVWLVTSSNSAPASTASAKAIPPAATTTKVADATPAATTSLPVASAAAPVASAEPAAPEASSVATTDPTSPAPNELPSGVPIAKASSSSAPTPGVVASAPGTTPASAAPAGRSGGPASAAMSSCWRNNAPPGTPASSATASFQVDAMGKASAIAIGGPARSVSNFTPCSVMGIGVINFGPGAAGPVTASASFPAIK